MATIGTTGRTLLLLTSTIAAVATVYSASTVLAYAQVKEKAFHFNISAKTVRQGINEIGRTSGLAVVFNETGATSVRGSAVRGSMTPDEAIRTLLIGTGLSYKFTNNNTVTIFDAKQADAESANDGSLLLDTITVTGANGLITEGSGSYTTAKSTVNKTAESLRETPQSVTVITAKQIEDRGLNTLTEALQNATGVTVIADQYYSTGRYFSRGFEVNNIRIDSGAVGVTSTYDAISAVSLVKYDRVEVMRGADGLYTGNGEAGGVISLVRKRPLDVFKLSTEIGGGDRRAFKANADVTGPITSDGGLRGRFISSFDRNDTYYDDGRNNSFSLYGVLEADVTDKTTVMFGASYDKQNSKPWTAGLPRYSDGSPLDIARSTSLGTDWSYLHHKNWEIFGDVQHEFDNGWKWTTSGTYVGHKYNAKYGYIAGVVDPVSGDGLNYNGSYNWAHGYQVQFDTHLEGDFSLFNREHSFVIGADYAKHSSSVKRGEFIGPSINVSDLGNIRWDDADTPLYPGDYYFHFNPYGETRYGIYARGRFEITEPLHLILGARYGSYDYTFHRASYNRDRSVNWTEALDYDDKGIFTPFAAITYDVTKDWTAYISYADIYLSQARYLRGPEPGSPLKPITGRTFETGLKGEITSDLNGSIALYHTRRNGEAVYDPSFGGVYNPDNGSSCCYTDSGRVVSQGIDLELSGEIADGWQVFAGYTFNSNKDKTKDTLYNAITPKHQLKLWTSYNLPGDYSAWTFGAGIRAQSKTTVEGEEYVSDGQGDYIVIPYNIAQEAYAVADMSIRYDFNEATSLTMNVNNIFDKKYFSQLGTLSKNNVYGDARSFFVTLRSSF